MKNETKIREWLGDRYHLNVTLTYQNSEEKVSWKLFRKYYNFEFDGSKPIMTSDDNTDEELFEFAKAHRKFDELRILLKSNVVFAFIAVILVVLGLLLDCRKLLLFVAFGIVLMIISQEIIISAISKHNFKISKLEFAEKMLELHKREKEDKK